MLYLHTLGYFNPFQCSLKLCNQIVLFIINIPYHIKRIFCICLMKGREKIQMVNLFKVAIARRTSRILNSSKIFIFFFFFFLEMRNLDKNVLFSYIIFLFLCLHTPIINIKYTKVIRLSTNLFQNSISGRKRGFRYQLYLLISSE